MVQRGASVVLETHKGETHQIFPMIPGRIASVGNIIPGESRLCISFEFKIDKKGCVVNEQHFESIIQSRDEVDYATASTLMFPGVAGHQKQSGLKAYLEKLYSVTDRVRERRSHEGTSGIVHVDNADGMDNERPARGAVRECMLLVNHYAGRCLNRLGQPAPLLQFGAPDADCVVSCRTLCSEVDTTHKLCLDTTARSKQSLSDVGHSLDRLLRMAKGNSGALTLAAAARFLDRVRAITPFPKYLLHPETQAISKIFKTQNQFEINQLERKLIFYSHTDAAAAAAVGAAAVCAAVTAATTIKPVVKMKVVASRSRSISNSSSISVGMNN